MSVGAIPIENNLVTTVGRKTQEKVRFKYTTPCAINKPYNGKSESCVLTENPYTRRSFFLT
jgi:hypothetical protein